MVQKFCDQGRKTTFATLSAKSRHCRADPVPDATTEPRADCHGAVPAKREWFRRLLAGASQNKNPGCEAGVLCFERLSGQHFALLVAQMALAALDLLHDLREIVVGRRLHRRKRLEPTLGREATCSQTYALLGAASAPPKPTAVFGSRPTACSNGSRLTSLDSANRAYCA
jgi:hypothetical protein